MWPDANRLDSLGPHASLNGTEVSITALAPVNPGRLQFQIIIRSSRASAHTTKRKTCDLPPLLIRQILTPASISVLTATINWLF